MGDGVKKAKLIAGAPEGQLTIDVMTAGRPYHRAAWRSKGARQTTSVFRQHSRKGKDSVRQEEARLRERGRLLRFCSVSEVDQPITLSQCRTAPRDALPGWVLWNSGRVRQPARVEKSNSGSSQIRSGSRRREDGRVLSVGARGRSSCCPC